MLGWIGRLFGLGRSTSPTPQIEAQPAPSTDPAPPDAGPSAPDDAQTEGALLQETLLDRRQRAQAYLFSLQAGRGSELAEHSDRIRALLDEVLIGRLLALSAHWPETRSAWLRLDPASLTHSDLPRLAGLNAVVLLSPLTDLSATPEQVQQIRALQRGGLRFALRALPGEAWFESLAWLADHFILDFSQAAAPLQRCVAHLNQHYPLVPRVALQVDTVDALDAVWPLGCVLAAGAFVHQRGDWRGRPIAPEPLRVATLLAQIGADSENHEIAAVLKQDMALSYRLLRFVNTSQGGLGHAIGSIEQALLLLGRQQLYRWLALLVVASSEREPGNGQMEAALVRGRMLEVLAERLAPDARDELFVAGLFSMLDMLLQVPMETALAPLAISPAVREALLSRSGPYAGWLAIAEAGERGDPVSLFAACRAMAVPTVRAAHARMAALEWVLALSEPKDDED
ncbi:hypothetical protein GCM10025771_03870 [Niveibacterium umoris]|uniref:EAL and modified HD-GYP domain-containing signal transduction protein n=1 Tax=Niveibacterium umoris TaxID=1193620 RepID=A0A840BRA0_9RHOO|nr:HDOD domain-containing protein [Niveibacterium umoris]MBB4014068.1 EAL and modified HD-GYP domain-containing signal transduction protein [Niveibacterium umoris]